MQEPANDPLLTCALGPDSAGAVLAAFLAGAETAVDAAVYEVSGYYAHLFAAAARRGLRTRLLLDAHPGANSTTVRRLAGVHGPAFPHPGGARVECRVLRPARGGRRPCGTSHWKLLVRDEDAVALGSGNLIKRDAPRQPDAFPVPGTREWWAVAVRAPGLARAARDAFEDAWNGAEAAPVAWGRTARPVAPLVGVPQPLVGPLTVAVPAGSLRAAFGGGTTRALLLELISASRRRADITVPYVHTRGPAVRDLLSALDAAAGRGVAVRLLLGSEPDRADALELGRRSLRARVMDPWRSTTGHAKGAVLDGVAVVGSANWSEPGLGANHEAALAIDHPAAAAYFRDAFDRDWAVSPELGTPGLAWGRRGYALGSP